MGMSTTTNDLASRMEAMEQKVNGKTATQAKEERLCTKAYTSAFWNHMHTGEVINELREGSDGKGGYLVPPTYEKELVDRLNEENIVRKISTIIETAHDLRIPVSLTEGEGGWVEEGEEIRFMDATFGQVKLGAYKLQGGVLVSDELLDDSGIDLETYIKDTLVKVIAEHEEEAFLVGDGKGKPKGIIYQAEDGVETTETGIFSMDDVVSLIHSLKKAYRKNAVFVMSEDAHVELQRIKFYDGRPA